jgi:hypothetical protein
MIAPLEVPAEDSREQLQRPIIHGIGVQNLVDAARTGCRGVSDTAVGPNFWRRRQASSFVRPVESGTSCKKRCLVIR